MKCPLISLLSLGLLLSTGVAEEKPAAAAVSESQYVNEASLPEGWPMPGPYGKVSKKEYPVYRAAYTSGNGEGRSFWTLFSHIKSNDIPMTAPVEMEMEEVDGEMEMTTMGFLYKNPKVGEEGMDGEKVKVMTVSSMTVLSYTWMGPSNDQSLATAKAALEAELARQSLTPLGFRVLGYNGPSVPKAKRTHEMQAILKK